MYSPLLWKDTDLVKLNIRMSDRYGRKITIQMGCVWALWGCSMQAGAPNIACLLIGRIVAGVAIGILSMVVPLYNVSETIILMLRIWLKHPRSRRRLPLQKSGVSLSVWRNKWLELDLSLPIG